MIVNKLNNFLEYFPEIDGYLKKKDSITQLNAL